MTRNTWRVAIVGGGPVGLAAALALEARGLAPIVLEASASDSPDDDPRALALAYGTRLILERLGVWQRIEQAEPIQAVHVSQRGGLGRARLTAVELGLPALGYVVGYGRLAAALRRRVVDRRIDLIRGARVISVTDGGPSVHLEVDRAGVMEGFEAELAVQADGTAPSFHESRMVVRDYAQWALVADVRCEHARAGEAYERFTPDGPIALLPRGDRYALVWTVAAEQAEALLGLDPVAFAAELRARFGEHVGAFTLHGAASGFPLKLRFVRDITGRRIVLVGNAAQTLHPVAAQGFNLGLRDAYEVARALGEATEPSLALAKYARARRLDRSGAMLLTDLIVRGFGVSMPGAAAARGLALAALDAIPVAKRFFLHRMIFGARG